MDAFNGLLHGFEIALMPTTLIAAIVGGILGTVVGILPGIGSSAAVALLLPLSYSMPPVAALSMLAGVWYGSTYGGIITSVLLNIPGEGDAVIATLDGFQMAKDGRGGVALGVSALGGFFAGTVALIFLMYIGPTAAQLSLKFSPADFFALMFMGLSLIIWLSGDDMAKALISAAIGLLIGSVGIDATSGQERLTFGSVEMLNGIDLVPVVIGLFGLGEALTSLGEAQVTTAPKAIKLGVRQLLPENAVEWLRTVKATIRGTVCGIVVGLLPGAGPTISTFVAYAIEKKSSRDPQRFGKGAIEGVASPEAASHSATIAGLVPLLSLGLPSSSTAAVLLGGFLIHGLVPGPLLFRDHPDIVWGLIASLYIANLFLLLLNTALIPLLIWSLQAVKGILPPLIAVLVIIGAYSIRSSVFDVWLAVGFGLLGFVFRILGVPLAPLIIALVLGPKAEIALRQSLVLSDGSFLTFVSDPWSAVMVVIAFFIFLQPAFRWARKSWAPRAPATAEYDATTKP
jgi:putative tricarboxylic transport membrane protein